MDVEKSEQLRKELRGYLFTPQGVPAKVKEKLSNQYRKEGIDIEDMIRQAQKDIIPAEIDPACLLAAAVRRNWFTLVSKIETSLPANEGRFQIAGQFKRLSSLKKSPTVKEDIEHLKKRATMQRNASPEFAGEVKEFAELCRKFYLDETPKMFSILHAKELDYIENQVLSYRDSGTFAFHQYIQLAEDVYDDYRRNCSDLSSAYSVVLGVIHTICRNHKVEIPTAEVKSVCPGCGDTGQTGDICNLCGTYLRCPNCHTLLVKDRMLCGGCGTEVTSIPQWIGMIARAEKLCTGGDVAGAERLIEPIRMKWTKNPSLLALLERIRAENEHLADKKEKLNRLLEDKCFQAARWEILEIKKRIQPDQELRDLEQIVNRRLGQAEVCLEEAAGMRGIEKQAEKYVEAITLVNDYSPAIERLKEADIPVPVLKCRQEGCMISLTWDALQIKGAAVGYVVEKQEVPSGAWKEIMHAGATACTDVITEGISCFYRLKAELTIPGTKFSVVLSNFAGSPELMATGEVEILRKTAGDRVVTIEFRVPSRASEVRVERTCGAEKRRLRDNYKDGKLTDSDVQNDRTYHYRIIACFKNLKGESVESAGVTVGLVPGELPCPVELIPKNKIGETELSWKSSANGRILIYSSTGKFTMREGEQVNVDRIGGQLQHTTAGTVLSVKHDFHGVRYYVAIHLKGEVAVAGKQVEVSSVMEPTGLQLTAVREGEVKVNWRWEPGLEAVCLTTAVDEGRGMKKVVTRKENNRGEVMLTVGTTAKRLKAELTAYALLPSGKELISKPVCRELALQKVSVSLLGVRKKGFFFSDKYELTVEASGIPACDLNVVIGENLPPVNVMSFSPYLVFASKEFAGRASVTKVLHYRKKAKNAKLYFRIVPADRQTGQQVKFINDMRNI